MKRTLRILCLVMAVALLPLQLALSETADDGAALLSVTYYDSDNKKAAAEPLTDGSDETGLRLERAETAKVSFETAEGDACKSVYVRLNVSAVSVTVEWLNKSAKKYEVLQTVYNPGCEFVITLDEATAGKLRLQVAFSKVERCSVLELLPFSAGALPDTLHNWTMDKGEVDVLLAVDTAADLDAALINALIAEGYSLGVCVMNSGAQPPAPIFDALWDAGARIQPSIAASGKTVLEMLTWLRQYKPMLLVTDEALLETAKQGMEQAADYSAEVELAARSGVWITPDSCTLADDVLAKAAAIGERSDAALLQMCIDRFADALSADTAMIPYPQERDENGYLPEGEFLYENKEDGLWAYLSPSIQIEIVRYTQPDVPSLWFEVDLTFDPQKEQFKQHILGDKTYLGPYEKPDVLAQKINLVLGINSDYYPFRVNNNRPTGVIIRNRTLVYNLTRSFSGYPPLDTLALRDDGSFSIYSQGEITGDALLAQGDVHDALSFGPILVRDGRLCLYGGSNWYSLDPRMAIGMTAPGHYKIVMVEGKMPGDGEQGFDMNQLAQLMYARGMVDAFNLDGGSTASLIFMGQRLNRTGKATAIGSPREQNELFGLGYSQLVHAN